ncbi:MAG: AIR synthase family protein [Candidatus Methanofastidiosia archaeon]
MYAGKIPPALLKKIVLSSLGAPPKDVVVGPSVGEDAAVLKLGDIYQVVACDPVTGASKNIGYHAVHVNANDVAVTGADPKYFMPAILLHKDSTEDDLKEITRQIDVACKEVGASVIGGHTEITPGIDHTIIVGTMFGYTKRYITTSGASPGDAIILTKGAAIEGTSILANEYEETLNRKIGKEATSIAKTYSSKLSIVPEAKIIRKYVTSMHDPTEGGIAGALNELSAASGCGFSVPREAVPVSPETAAICSFYSCDPLTLISSGSLIATVREPDVKKVLSLLHDAGIDAAKIGSIKASGCTLAMPEHDALWDILT